MSASRGAAVKICGLTRPDDALVAVQAGAAYLGAILAGGPRRLDIAGAARVLGPQRAGVRRAAVFGALATDDIAAIADALDLDVVQLHGDPTADEVREVRARTPGRTVWPVLRIAGTTLPDDAAALTAAAGWVVLDAKVVGALGGTGVRLDWAGLAASVAALRHAVPEMQLVLAGGLRPDNVKEAISLLAPDVVDVSSGVELSPGVKDPAAVAAFVTAARVGMSARAAEEQAR